MIKAQDIYNASRDGLDIILYYYPQAADCVDNKKKFKRRLNEDDASACLKKYGDCYKVTDFGDQGTAMSPIDICMYEENINFQEAVALLASRYNVTDELKRSVNKPDIRKRPATAEEAEGAKFFELETNFTQEQLRVLGPRVEQKHVEALHWYVAKSVSYVRNREVTTKYTTPTYPIFIRECIIEDNSDPEKVKKFFKIYEPLNPDKQWRFSYTPEGAKPKQYINGFYELQKAYAKFNADEEAKFLAIPGNEEKPYKEQKLPEAFICSGERDALCVRALGYYPLWFNSETYKVTPEEIKSIYKYVEVLYNIPDIDSTGVAKGTELALRFLQIHTVWLPSWLSNYKDQRGKPRKDFRDFVELRPKHEDFKKLLNMANPAQFWIECINDRTKKKSLDIDTDCLHYFLGLHGFCTLKDDNSDSARYIRIHGHIVEQIKARDINKFMNTFVRERYLTRDIRNLVLNSQRLSESSLAGLPEVNLNFCNYTPDGQYLFFQDQKWYVTKNGVEVDKTGAYGDRYVWDTNVIKHKVSLLPDFFNIDISEDATGNRHYDIRINNHNSNIFRYLINTSRVFWRKELEYAWENSGIDEADAYRAMHKFDICGPLLSTEEINEQKQNLISKIFSIGYILHRYKSPSRAWALYAMDNKIGEDGQCNGRSGKSFLFNAVSNFLNTVRLSGRNPKLLDNPHVFDQVNKHTDFIYVDDCDKYLSFQTFYDMVTGGMTVNPKNNRSFFIPFEEAPKFGFSTNYVPLDMHGSTEARLLYMVFSDYYHQKAEENDYIESRSIRDDFGKNLLTDYNEDEWNNDINFFVQCLVFYLKMTELSICIQPPMSNILKRKLKQDMGANFEDWAYQYFAEDGDNLDKNISREEALENFRRFANLPRITMQKFTKSLKAFAELCTYIYCMNPPELLNSAGRLMQKSEGKTIEMIHLRTVAMQEKIQTGAAYQKAVDNNESNMPFTPIVDKNDEPF